MARNLLIWGAVALLALVPVALAASSPWLAYRDAVYVIASFAGILGLSVLLVQPLLASGHLPGTKGARGRKLHRWLGAALIIGVVLHVGGLYLTSPPDTLDALMLVAPTAFSVYGVIALWTVLITGVLALYRRRLGPRIWPRLHSLLTAIIVIATVVHAVQIEGLMEPVSKWVLSIAALGVTGTVFLDLRVLRPIRRRRAA